MISINRRYKKALPSSIDNTPQLIPFRTNPHISVHKPTALLNMLLFLLIFPIFAISSGLQAVRFGESKSAETLFPLPSATPAQPESFPINQTKEEVLPLEPVLDGEEPIMQAEFDHDARTERKFNMDDHFHNKDGDDWGLYVPIDLHEDTTVVRRAVGLEKRAAHVGVVQMDCKIAHEVCQNAGYYQNCLMGAKGNYRAVEYINGPSPKGERVPNIGANARRQWSGVSLVWSTPCKAWPFSQKFWDHSDVAHVNETSIQTDEWPMATMQGVRYTHNPGQTPPRAALRCMHNSQNSIGGAQVTNFIRGHGPYFHGGPWVRHRPNTLPNTRIALGDWFNVDFNFDSFTPADQTWRLA